MSWPSSGGRRRHPSHANARSYGHRIILPRARSCWRPTVCARCFGIEIASAVRRGLTNHHWRRILVVNVNLRQPGWCSRNHRPGIPDQKGYLMGIHRIGLVVPSSNVTVETEMPTLLNRHADAQFSFHSSRMRMQAVSPEQLRAMNAQRERCILELGDAGVDAILYACLVALMSVGPGGAPARGRPGRRATGGRRFRRGSPLQRGRPRRSTPRDRREANRPGHPLHASPRRAGCRLHRGRRNSGIGLARPQGRRQRRGRLHPR